MYQILTIVLATLLTSALSAQAQSLLTEQSANQLETRLAEINARLDRLAHYSPRSGSGSIGYRSDQYDDPHHTEWVQISLDQLSPIDQIVLVPTLWRDMQGGFVSDGFPVQFRILAGTTDAPQGTVIASISRDDPSLTGIAPFIIPCATTASWVRVEASELSPRQFDGQYNLELAEVMIFNGPENLALNQPVTIPENTPSVLEAYARKREFLVDGFVPYLMNSGFGTKRTAYISKPLPNTQPSILIDLEKSVPLNRIHLHTVEVSDTAPQALPSGYALPKRLLIEGANHSDFSDAIRLIDYEYQSIYDVGPILIRGFPETRCRYVRLTALEPYILNEDHNSTMGFAEIELFFHGENMALHRPIEGLETFKNRPLSALTDGSNIYGKILPVRQWMGELALRQSLENERPLIIAELNRRHARQKANLRRLAWLASLLATGIVITILIDRILRMRQIAIIRERFAADLHDELGANLHAIEMLGELANDSLHTPNELEETIKEIRALAGRTNIATRDCIHKQTAPTEPDLPKDMHRTAQRILTGIESNIQIEGEPILNELNPAAQYDLFLFYKESLVNISRHSGASCVDTQLTATPQNIQLIIHDNGCGLSEKIPSSLKRRARLLKGKITASSSNAEGTCIMLKLKICRRHRRHFWSK
jgi:signal transduction histidine kinase